MGETEYRRPWLTSRQVGMIAAFGGLGFAWRALGLVIPLVPPFLLDIRETINVIAAFAGGPFVAIGVGILVGLPSAVPYADVVYYPMIGISLSLFTKYVWRIREDWGKLKALIVLAIVLLPIEFIWITVFIGEMAVMGVVSFWPEFYATMGVTFILYWVQEFLPLWICIYLFPDFMKPTWSWRGGEELEE
ncbi:MAG: hypothetical protein ACE5R6_17065 [Candidatus Heimdallarchaeota archaeon]